MKNRTGVLRQSGILTLLAALVLQLCLYSSALASQEARIHGIRIGVHDRFTRLVFDAEGPHPLSVGPPSDSAVTVLFSKLQMNVQPDGVHIPPLSAISRVSVQSQDDSVKMDIALRYKNTTVRQSILDNTPQRGWYKIVIDFYPPSGQREEIATQPPAAPNQPPASPAKAAPPAAPPAPAEKATSVAKPAPHPIGSLWSPAKESAGPPSAAARPAPSPSAAPQTGEIVAASELFNQGKYAQAYDAYDAVLKESPPNANRTDALYGLAHSYFQMKQGSLSRHASKIVELYAKALEADGSSAQAPLALYRCGLSFAAAGNQEKAEPFFEQIVSNHADSPLVGLSWIGLGQTRLQKRVYPEAVLAFRSALGFPLDKAGKAEAYYGLGKSLSAMNQHEPAVQNLKACLNEDPLYYRTSPDLFKYLGESLFGLKSYAESQNYLFWYLNLEPAAQDRDLLLARIAETLSHEGQAKLMKRLQEYIRNQYPDSEGSAISQIRTAEAIEDSDQPSKREQAKSVYLELSNGNLSAPLSRLVRFKLATMDWKDGEYEKALTMVDGLLHDGKETMPTIDAAGLKQKIVADWIRKAFSEKSYLQVVELSTQHASILRSIQSPELDLMVADSNAEMKLYPNAMETYERLMAAGSQNSDELAFKTAQCAYRMGNMDRALQLLAQVKSPSMEAPRAEMLATIYFLQKNYPKVIQSLEKLLQKDSALGSVKPDTLLDFSESFMRTGKLQESLSWLQKTMDHLSQDDTRHRVRALLLESQCYIDLKQPAKAIEVVEAALPLVSSEDLKNELNYQLSSLYMETEQKDKAVQMLNQLQAASEPLWKAAAQQRLDYLQMRGSDSKSF